MKICLVSQEYPPETPWGGVGTQTWVKARMLVRLGHEVHVLSCTADETAGLRTRIEDGVVVHRMQPPGYEFPIYGKPLYMLGYTWRVAATLHDLMCRHTFERPRFSRVRQRGLRLPTRPHGVELGAGRRATAWTVGDVPGVVGLAGASQPAASTGRFHGGVLAPQRRCGDGVQRERGRRGQPLLRHPRESIDVVHCGVDTDFFRPAEAGDRLAERPTVLFAGKLVKNKGAVGPYGGCAFVAAQVPRHPPPACGVRQGHSGDDPRPEPSKSGPNRTSSCRASSAWTSCRSITGRPTCSVRRPSSRASAR